MAISLTLQEISHFRSQLATYPEALEALDEIENCEGDLEDATISLALKAGQEPDTSEKWLDSLAKRCRVALCQDNLRDDIKQNNLNIVMDGLIAQKICPVLLISPILIYVIKIGVDDFCEPLQYMKQPNQSPSN
ncbi:MAG: hypothetical protein ACRC2J_04325 [Microcoleaceae cyanobacterium]